MNGIDILTSVANIVIALTAIASACFSLITLFLVYFQLREMNHQTHSLAQNIRSASYQSIVGAERDLWSRLGENKEFMDQHMGEFKIVKQYGLSPEQLLNVSLLCAHYENVYYQFREGVVPKELWPEWERAIVNNINKPMIRKIWHELKYWYWEEFALFVDGKLEEITPKDSQTGPANESITQIKSI